MAETVPLRSVGRHLVQVPVRVGNSEPARFILDTGIGLNLVSRALLKRVGGRLTGETFTGRRMSGQAVSAPLARVESLALGSIRRDEALVGVFDFDVPSNGARIDGFLSPEFFGSTPFTIRRRSALLTLGAPGETPGSDRAVRSVPLGVERDGPSVSLFVDLDLPDGRIARVEVDTGSDHLILDARFMEALGRPEGSPGVRKVEGTDETGHRYVRYFTRVSGRISLHGSPELAQNDPDVLFQSIIYDGLLGDDFLRRFDVTYDLADAELRFALPRGE